MIYDKVEKTRMEAAHSRGVTTSDECLLIVIYTQEPRAESETLDPDEGAAAVPAVTDHQCLTAAGQLVAHPLGVPVSSYLLISLVGAPWEVRVLKVSQGFKQRKETDRG